MTPSTDELARLASVMDRLRSPGGCPWDAEQTHQSLLKYLLEESYEYIEAVESGDPQAMREELGDLLLQVYFHARIAEERSDQAFSINDVAKSVADKLINRHPHVFGDAVVSSSAEVKRNWEEIKNAEKQRTTPIDGVPLGQPALPLTAKLIHRADKNSQPLPTSELEVIITEPQTSETIGRALMAIAVLAHQNEIDPEAALREVALKFATTLGNSSVQ